MRRNTSIRNRLRKSDGCTLLSSSVAWGHPRFRIAIDCNLGGRVAANLEVAIVSALASWAIFHVSVPSGRRLQFCSDPE